MFIEPLEKPVAHPHQYLTVKSIPDSHGFFPQFPTNQPVFDIGFGESQQSLGVIGSVAVTMSHPSKQKSHYYLRSIATFYQAGQAFGQLIFGG